MKALWVIALLASALPAAAQNARPLPPDSFIYDADRARIDLKAFEAPRPVTVISGVEHVIPARPLPADSFKDDRIPLRQLGEPQPPKPAPKPEKGAA